MKWVSRLVQVLLALVALGLIALVIRSTLDHSRSGHFRTYAELHDASHLPVGSRVMIAGVTVGEISGLGVDGRLARLDIKLDDGIALYEDAYCEKKAESLFGDGYLEIHPGTPDDGHRRLVSGDPIPRALEGVSTDRTLRSLDEGMPRVQEALRNAGRFADEARRTVDGPLTERIEALDRAVKDPSLTAPIDRADQAMTGFLADTTEAEQTIAYYAPKVNPALDHFNDQVVGVTGDMKDGEQQLKDALGGARKSIDKVDPYIDEAGEVVARLNGRVPPEDQGTLGRLINDPKLGEQISDISYAGAQATGSFTRSRSTVVLRGEWDIIGQQPRVSVGVELAGRHDSFYLLEAEQGGSFLLPNVDATMIPGTGNWVRTATQNENLRLTAQWGRKVGNLELRFGLRENDFGVGLDAKLLHDRIELRNDLSLPSFARVPRLKLTAALKLYESIYVSGGVDDVLLPGGDLPINVGTPPGGVPTALDHIHFGRDVFVGGYLRFTDRDLDSLLLLYGAVIFSLL